MDISSGSKTNVKSIMAKFSNNLAEEIHTRQVKMVGQPSSVTKSAFEKFSQLENAGLPLKPSSFNKPASLKPPVGTKPSLPDSSDKYPKPPPLKSSSVTSKVTTLTQAVNREANDNSGFLRPLGPKLTEEPKLEPRLVFPKPIENRLPGPTPPRNELKPSGLRPSFKIQPQEEEVKPVLPKGIKENFIAASQENESKMTFSKPPLRQKPSPHPIHNEEGLSKSTFLNRTSPGPTSLSKKANSFCSTKYTEQKSNKGTDSTTGPFPPLKHVANHSNQTQVLQKSFARQNEEAKPNVKNIYKPNKEITESNSVIPSTKFPILSKETTIGLGPSKSEKEEKDKNGPKRKAVPPLFKLGPPPQKPSRPPVVDLEKYRKANEKSCTKPPSVDLIPPLPLSIPATQTATSPLPPPLPPSPPGSHPSTQAPILPPRNIKPRSNTILPENDENYDDAEFDSGGTRKTDEHQSSDGEMYEDVDDMRLTGKGGERKMEKEERKKSDQEKKEQKEKEKKEQEIKKKFKLTGHIEIIHQARACTDFKGGKNDLSFKQGDPIEIIRLTDNPEGKWLGRMRGSYGYIKTTMVEVDYDSLRKKPHPLMSIEPTEQDSDQEVYDDVGDQDTISSGAQSTTGVGFPPPSSPDDVYDGVEDEDDFSRRSVSQEEEKNNTWPRGLLKILKGKTYPKKSVRETTAKVNVIEDNGSSSGYSAKQGEKDSEDSDVYDDVESTDFPPPPKEFSLGLYSKSLGLGKAKSEDHDSQKLKKIEKEEKEFRKKFKYEGDIQVLYTTAISRASSPKKKGSKDLPVKPGDSVEVIKNVDENTVLCRNEDGKYGYVRRSCIADEEDEIYDDIADGCIYDND